MRHQFKRYQLFNQLYSLLHRLWRYTLVDDAGILRREDITTPIVSLVYDVNGEVAAGVAGVDAVVRIFCYFVLP